VIGLRLFRRTNVKGQQSLPFCFCGVRCDFLFSGARLTA